MVEGSEFRVLVTARSGSRSIPDKNIVKVGGHPLLAYSIALAVMEFGTHRTWLSTDSRRYANIAEDYGADVPFLRPEALASDATSDLAVFEHAMEMEKSMGLVPAALWVHLRPTTPLRDGAQIREALTIMRVNPEASSLRSVEVVNGTPQKWLTRDANGFLRTLGGSFDIDEANQPRQNFPSTFKPNGVVDVIRREEILAGRFHGTRSFALLTATAIDVDNNADLANLQKDTARLAGFAHKYFRN